MKITPREKGNGGLLVQFWFVIPGAITGWLLVILIAMFQNFGVICNQKGNRSLTTLSQLVISKADASCNNFVVICNNKHCGYFSISFFKWFFVVRGTVQD